jgi:cytochrome c551
VELLYVISRKKEGDRMLKRAMVVSGLVLSLAACGGGEESSGGESNGGGGEVDTAAAEETFQQSCASCHGGDLSGGAGPALENVGSDLSEEEIRTKIEEGGGGMPANLIEGEKADNVAAWLAEKK